MDFQTDANAVDFGYLEAFLGGDAAVVAEVLGLFDQQAAAWRGRLDLADPGLADTLHTVKGAARGVGALRLAAAAEAAEQDPGLLPGVLEALDATLAEVAAYRKG